MDPPKPNHSTQHSVYTAQQQERLLLIAKEAEEKFPITKTCYFDSARQVKDAVQSALGDKFGFKVSLQSSSVICSKHELGKGYEKNKQKRSQSVPPAARRERKPNRCQCSFELKFSPVGKILRQSPAFQGAPLNAVVLTSASYFHSNGCFPCGDQLRDQKRVAGAYANDASVKNVFDRLLWMSHYSGGKIDVKVLRNALREQINTKHDMTYCTGLLFVTFACG